MSGNIDNVCQNVLNAFKRFDSNAQMLSVPSQNGGICMIVHSPFETKPKIGGATSNSPLSNASIFTFERSGNQWINLHQTSIPDVNSIPNQVPPVDVYIKNLSSQGLRVSGKSQNWASSDPAIITIYHQSVGMDPVEFANRTVNSMSVFKAPSSVQDTGSSSSLPPSNLMQYAYPKIQKSQTCNTCFTVSQQPESMMPYEIKTNCGAQYCSEKQPCGNCSRCFSRRFKPL